MAITLQDVEAVCDAFVARGEEPSLDKVRKALGDTGSKNTVQRLVAKWRQHVADALLEAEECSRDFMIAQHKEMIRRQELVADKYKAILCRQVEDCEAIEQQLLAAEQHMDHLQKELKQEQDARQQVDIAHARQLAVLEDQASALQRNLADTIAERDGLRHSIADISTRDTDTETRLTQTQQRCNELESSIQATMAENAELRHSIANETGKKEELQRRLVVMERDLQAALMDIAVNAAAAAEVQRLREALAKREEMVRELIQLVAGKNTPTGPSAPAEA